MNFMNSFTHNTMLLQLLYNEMKIFGFILCQISFFVGCDGCCSQAFVVDKLAVARCKGHRPLPREPPGRERICPCCSLAGSTGEGLHQASPGKRIYCQMEASKRALDS